MKPVRRWVWLSIALIVLVLILLSRKTVTDFISKQRQPGISEHQPSAAKPDLSQKRSLDRSSLPLPILPEGTRSEESAKKLEHVFEDRNVPINFWGKLVDQNDTPIADGTVQIRVRKWGHVPELGTISNAEKYSVQTKSNGEFSLSNARGDVLAIDSINKDGYILSSKGDRSFNYLNRDSYLPDNGSPYIFRMWKLAESEPLKSLHLSQLIPYDGRPVWINLTEGQIIEGNGNQGDLKITLERSPLNLAPTNREPFDWHATIFAGSGGVIYSTDEFMYKAPTEGYKESLEISMPRTATNWTSIMQVPLYLKSRNGQLYGRATLEFRVDYSGPKTGFTIDAALNLNGSTNLQP